MSLCASHIPRSKFPQVHKVYGHSSTLGNILHLLGNVLLACALDVDVLDVAGGVVTANGLPEVGRDVCAGAMDDQRVEEDCVPFFHVQMNPGVAVSAPDAVVHFVDAVLPVRVVVLLEDSLVGPGLDHQATVTVVNVLHGGPGRNDPVGWPEGEVVEVLVERMARGAGTRVRRLVNQHCVDGANVFADKTLNIVQQFGQSDIFGQDFVPNKVLNLVVYPLVRQPFFVLEREVLHLEDAAAVHLVVDDVQEALPALVDLLLGHQVGDD